MHLLPLLAAAETAAPGMMETFGVETKSVIVQAVSFLILFVVLYYFGIRPILATMGERQAKISEGLKHAEDMRLKLEETRKATEGQLQLARDQGNQLIEEARRAAKDLSDRQQREATERANSLIEKAQAAIELEKRKMLAEARTEIARLVVATTQRVLGRELPEAEKVRYNESAARELSQV